MNGAVVEVLAERIPQKDFAEIVGLSEARVSQLVKEGLLVRGATGGEWLLAYCDQLREVAAGRAPSAGELDPIQEKAALDREKRMGQRIKNYVALEKYAPVELLTKVLANASAAVVAKLDALPGELLKVAPDLSDEAIAALRTAVAQARNDWAGDTASLELADLTGEDDDGDDDFEGGDD